MPLVALLNKDMTMTLKASGQATATTVVEEDRTPQNPMLVTPGKMMTRS